MRQDASVDRRLAEVERIWQRNRCIKRGSVAVYRYWIRRFCVYCRACQLDERAELTRDGAELFARWWRAGASPRRGRLECTIQASRSALRAWANARSSLGEQLPPWQTPPPPQHVPAIAAAFAAYLRDVRGNPPTTIRKKLAHVAMFGAYCRSHERASRCPRLQDIDRFVVTCRSRYARSTVADICSTLRGYLRFLRSSGRMGSDLAGSVMAPIVRVSERPHRTLPWGDVQRILRAVDRASRAGRRDYAILLMMSVYGLGAGEIIGLTLDDINWRAATLHIIRPKTRNEFLLPLLPAVGRALVSYLRHGRPVHTEDRHLFVTMRTPHQRLACSVTIRHILHSAARRAGVTAGFLGTHVLRHTHACRQLELGTQPKLIGDILGHRDPESISAYLRVAAERLRDLSLPVPT
jgi:integrase